MTTPHEPQHSSTTEEAATHSTPPQQRPHKPDRIVLTKHSVEQLAQSMGDGTEIWIDRNSNGTFTYTNVKPMTGAEWLDADKQP